MAHEITNTDTMISVRKTPWHGLGVVLEAPPATTAEALQLSGLSWTVRTEPAFHDLTIPLDNGNTAIVRKPIPGTQVVIREDTNEILGSVGRKWTPVQNIDAFGWFDRWVDTGRVEIETAGSLFGGRRVWVLARIVSDPIVIKGDDVAEKYLLLAHGHDGAFAIRSGLTVTRVVCNNTLSYAVRQGERDGSLIRTSHTSNVLARLEDVADRIESIDARLSAAGELYRELARHDVIGGDKVIADYVAAVYKQSPEDVAKGRRLAHIEELFARGQGQDLPGSRGTWWGLYNALTEYETHGTADKPAAGRRESRASRNVWGAGAVTLDRGLEIALGMATKTYSLGEVFGEWSDVTRGADANHPDALAG